MASARTAPAVPQQELLLKTKLYIPPVRPDLVPRPRLIAQLDAGLRAACKLILISAPPGFGKTTLIANWKLSIDNCPMVWLALDEGDNDPARFLAYLVAAVQQIDPAIGQSVQGMLRSPQLPPPEALLTALVNDLASPSSPFVLVLDDYHLITALAVHRLLAFLVEHQPPQMRLVIITREDPPLPLARLRARQQVIELRQQDLEFTPDETADLLRHAQLDAADVAALHQRTEGWIAGLQLLAFSLRGHQDARQLVQAFTGSNRYVLDYLGDEVFQRQTVEVQEFLLKTSVLDRLCGPLCDAVAGRTDSQALLQRLEQTNLFIVPLDQSRTWYRYHRLFGELLRHRLRTYGRPESPLCQVASQWFEDQGYSEEAVKYALAARDWERAARLVGAASEGMLKRGEATTLIHWCAQLPGELVRAVPPLYMAYAWALLLTEEFDLAGELLDHAERQAQADKRLLGLASAAQAYLARARGDSRRLIEKSQQALALLPETEAVSRGMLALNLGLACWHEGHLAEAEQVLSAAQSAAQQAGNRMAELTAQVFLARTLACRGSVRQAATLYQQMIQTGGQIPILALAHYDMCALRYEWNDLDEAEEHLRPGLELSVHSGNAEFQVAGHLLDARLKMARGNAAAALEAIQTACTLARALLPTVHARVAAAHVQIALAQGDLDTAQRVGKDTSAEVDAHPFYRFLGLTQPRLLLAQGKKSLAAEQLDERLATASRAGWGYAVVAVRVLLALAAPTPAAALTHLTEALKLAQPEGYVRAFVDEGEPLKLLIADFRLMIEKRAHGESRKLVEYTDKLLAAFPRLPPVTPSQSEIRNRKSGMVELLSERELEVLRLVAAGRSNREIAARLVISPGTAKSHVNHICGKLGARNRTEAATRAKELGLI